MQPIKILITCLFIIYPSTFVKAQTINEEQFKNQIYKLISSQINFDKVKDSAAVYTFCIKIEVKKQMTGKQIVNFEINNPTVLPFFKEIEKLKDLDFTPVMKQRQVATFICPVFILVFASHDKGNYIKTGDISDAMLYLNVENAKDFDKLGMMSIKFDKNVYH